jgi:hypothetical protein
VPTKLQIALGNGGGEVILSILRTLYFIVTPSSKGIRTRSSLHTTMVLRSPQTTTQRRKRGSRLRARVVCEREAGERQGARPAYGKEAARA